MDTWCRSRSHSLCIKAETSHLWPSRTFTKTPGHEPCLRTTSPRYCSKTLKSLQDITFPSLLPLNNCGYNNITKKCVQMHDYNGFTNSQRCWQSQQSQSDLRQNYALLRYRFIRHCVRSWRYVETPFSEKYWSLFITLLFYNDPWRSSMWNRGGHIPYIKRHCLRIFLLQENACKKPLSPLIQRLQRTTLLCRSPSAFRQVRRCSSSTCAGPIELWGGCDTGVFCLGRTRL